MKRLVIDTDPGVDDAHAILMALAYPGARVEAITTVAGNVPLERTTANALTILDVAQRPVPVYAGCDRAILAVKEDASHVHGSDGLGNTNYPPSMRKVESEHAVQALVRLADESPGELTLVTIGPLTNVALALRLDPALPEKYAGLVVMGGAIRSMGNTSHISAEFNIFSDPEAGAIVFDAWKDFTLVSWETTMANPFTPEQIDRLGTFNNPRSKFFHEISQNTIKFIQEVLGRQVLFAADSLAMAVALEPDIVTSAEHRFVQVETEGNRTRGQTTVDWFNLSRREANANIVLEVDRERFWQLMEMSVK
jgi:purine nucleosidase